jgi:hypothetical protein
VREHRNVFSEIIFLQWLWKRTMNFFRDKIIHRFFWRVIARSAKRKQVAMFVPDSDQNMRFPRLPEKRRSASALRLCLSLLKIADKSRQRLSIFNLSTVCG